MSISFSEDAQQEVVTSSRVLPEDSGEGSLRPRLLKDYTGQEKAKENLQVCIDAARLRGEPLDHVLLYGPPGLGKTTMAAVIANEMGVNMRITSGPAIEKAGDLAALLTNLQEHDILFVDEIHRLNRAVEEILYPAMEDYAIDIIIGKGPSANSIRLDLPRFTLIGATTRAGQLTAPLRDRFGVNLRLELYSPAELQKIIERSAGILKVEIYSAAAYEISSRSRGTPRIANRLLKRVRDYAQVRADGVITIEESKTAETYSEVVEGMMFDRGYITPYMVTDTDKMVAVIDDAYILITDKKISNIQEILPLLEQIVQSGKKLVIIAEDIEGEALTTLIVNKLRGTFTVVGVKAPGYGDRRKEMLTDIATLTGGQVISSELGLELKDTTVDQLGRARQVKIDKENTIIVDGAGDKAAIDARVAQMREAAGAPCKARRRRSGYQGRCGYRGRNERAEDAH